MTPTPSSDKHTALVNTAVIVIGSYHLPISIAFGALVGSSLFILSRRGHGPVYKAWLFALSYFSGVFGGEDAAAILNWMLPDRGLLQINEFTGAVLASAFSVALIQYAYSIIDRRTREEEDL
ncbi:putative holin [Eikenella corrodens]|uniref:putative holin n=1 Tax=Eikenella corrodens TaxID=539 RepID=UPI0028E98447|nr:putative holin [Eikenella corrodens]